MIEQSELEAGLYWAEYAEHCFREIKIRKCLVYITGSGRFLSGKVIWPHSCRRPIEYLQFVERLTIPANVLSDQTLQAARRPVTD